jgi:hypothetical protein
MDKRYVFRGNASGVGARIVRPKNLVFTAAPSSLSVIGGVSESFVDSSTPPGGLWGKVSSLFRSSISYDGILSFKSASTKANGFPDGNAKGFKTVVNSVVQTLNVENRLTAGTLESTLTSTHADNGQGQEPGIVPVGTRILDLQADGYPIQVTLDLDLFTKYPTKASLATAYATDDDFYRKYGKRFEKSNKDKGGDDPKNRQIPTVSGFIVTSVVSDVKTENPRATVSGNVITLKDFGKIYLGELLITDAYRRLTLLRLKLGSPVEGDLACAEVETNGLILE